ncbi:MAG: WGxxGxxG-CTERM domain-containing protein [Sphingomicrobium sp.]
MRVPIALVLGAAAFMAPQAATAQADNETVNTTTAVPAPEADANLMGATPPADNSMMADPSAPAPTDVAMTDDPYAAPAAPVRPQRPPWGLLGLLGLVGLLGRRRADRG